MSRLGTALGAQAETFFGIAGLGDLVVTCLSKHSRNRFVGVEIGKGRSLGDITADMTMVAEGVWTTQSAFELSKKIGTETPIIDETYRILFEGKDHRQATTDLMMRAPKEE
jgi:glycerol-3-phosphate dehydrogenase (NAD(P)+)